MRRTRILLVVFAVVGGSLASCSDDSDSSADEAAPTTADGSPASDAVPSPAEASSTSPSAEASPTSHVPPAPGDVLPADRRTTWNPGVTYGGGGIPERDELCETLSPSGGDDTPAIQAALDSCPAGQVVQLEAGTFEISGEGLYINRSEITLRGVGSGEPGSGDGGTRLVKADRESNEAYPILYVGNDAGAFAESVDLAGDAVKGTNSVTLDRDPGLEVGEYVLVDHVTDDDPDVVWDGQHDDAGGASRSWFARPDRSLSQILEVTGVDGGTVTFATPLHWTFRTEFDAQLSRYGEYKDGPVRPFVEWIGVEDIYFYGGMGGDYHGNVAIATCAYCWVRNVESDFASGTSVGLYATYRSEIRDSYLHSSSDPNPGGGGYLTGVNHGAADNLIENNIMWNGNKVIVMRASGGGNVVAYNYMEDGYGDGFKSIPESGLNASHYTTPHMELMEGNQAFNFDGDPVWGNSIHITVYRNQFTGTRRSIGGLGLTDELHRRAVSLGEGHYFYNFVGNVLGADDMDLLPSQGQFVYEVDELVDDALVPMWELGYRFEDASLSFDPKVAETAIRHGNFDYVTNDAVYDPNLPQPLPPSLYLTSKPAFFGDQAWPWVTPEDPANPVASLPARERFDAMPPQEADLGTATTPPGAEGDADNTEGEGTADFEVTGPAGTETVEAPFDHLETVEDRAHLLWENEDGGYLVVELAEPSTGTVLVSTGQDPFFLEVAAADGGTPVATTNTSCSVTIDEISDASITGTFTCEPNPDGYSATGSFHASGP